MLGRHASRLARRVLAHVRLRQGSLQGRSLRSLHPTPAQRSSHPPTRATPVLPQNKFCPTCIAHGLCIPASRVRALPRELAGTIENKRSTGIWSVAWGRLKFRLVNQTERCSGSLLLIFEALPPESCGMLPQRSMLRVGPFAPNCPFMHL